MRRRSHISRRQARDAAGRFARKVEHGPRIVDNPAVVDPVDSEDDVKPEVERGPRVVHMPAVVIHVDSDSDVEPVVDPVDSDEDMEPEVERGSRIVHVPAVIIHVDSDSDIERRDDGAAAMNKHGASSSVQRLNVTRINSKVTRPKYVVTFDKVEIKCTFTDESDDEDPGVPLAIREIKDMAEEMRLAIKSKLKGHGINLK